MKSAREIVQALGGRWAGRYGTARCPAHEDKSPSLSVRDVGGIPVPHCFAGCQFKDVTEALDKLGLWNGNQAPRVVKTLVQPDNHEWDDDERLRIDGALSGGWL